MQINLWLQNLAISRGFNNLPGGNDMFNLTIFASKCLCFLVFACCLGGLASSFTTVFRFPGGRAVNFRNDTVIALATAPTHYIHLILSRLTRAQKFIAVS